MAELLGVVASGAGVVSLAFSIADSLKKLNDFCDTVKDAPEEIRLVLDEIEILSLLLGDIDENSQQNITVSPAIRLATVKSLRMCNVACRALQSLVTDLHDTLTAKKKRTSFKYAFKKEKVEELRGRLERAKSTMMLARDCYQAAMGRQDLEVVVAEMRHTQSLVLSSSTVQRHEESPSKGTAQEPRTIDVSSTQGSPIDWEGEKYSTLNQKRRYFDRQTSRKCKTWGGFIDVTISSGNASTNTTISLRLPTWLYARKYELFFRKSYQGFEQRLRSYKLVRHDAPTFQCCKNGDLVGLRTLFENRLASPFEVDLLGQTPLHYAARYESPEVCRLLIECGADANARTRYTSPTEAENSNCYIGMWPKSSTPLAFVKFGINQEVMKILVYLGESNPFDIDAHQYTIFHNWKLDLLALQWWLQQESNAISSLSILQCFTLIFSLLPDLKLLSIIHTTILQCWKLSIRVPAFSDPLGAEYRRDLNHLLYRCVDFSFWLSSRQDSERAKWTNMLLSCSLNLNSIESSINKRTPFLEIIRGGLGRRNFLESELPIPSMKIEARHFLEILSRCGTDLIAYGRKELELHNIGATSWHLRTNHQYYMSLSLYSINWTILDINIGPKPEDWNLIMDDEYVCSDPSYLDDFWTSIENCNDGSCHWYTFRKDDEPTTHQMYHSSNTTHPTHDGWLRFKGYNKLDCTEKNWRKYMDRFVDDIPTDDVDRTAVPGSWVD